MTDNLSSVHQVWASIRIELATFINSKIRHPKDAEDVLHDVFIKIHDKIGTVRDDTKLISWIWQITRNLVTDYFRNKGKFYSGEDVKVLHPGQSSQSLFMKEAIIDLIKKMDELPSEYCEALCLTEIEGMSQKEFASKVGLSYSGAKSRVQRARAMLKDMLMKCCHYEFDRYGTVLEIRQNHNCCCCR